MFFDHPKLLHRNGDPMGVQGFVHGNLRISVSPRGDGFAFTCRSMEIRLTFLCGLVFLTCHDHPPVFPPAYFIIFDSRNIQGALHSKILKWRMFGLPAMTISQPWDLATALLTDALRMSISASQSPKSFQVLSSYSLIRCFQTYGEQFYGIPHYNHNPGINLVLYCNANNMYVCIYIYIFTHNL